MDHVSLLHVIVTSPHQTQNFDRHIARPTKAHQIEIWDEEEASRLSGHCPE